MSGCVPWTMICSGNPNRELQKHITWWTDTPRIERKKVHSLTNRFQRTRRQYEANPVVDVVQFRLDFRRDMLSCKEHLRQSKEEDWRHFVGEHRNGPWGKIYQTWKGKRSLDNVGIKLNGEPFLTCNARMVNYLRDLSGRCLLPIALEKMRKFLYWGLVRLRRTMARFRLRKSPSWDGMNCDVWKALWWAVPSHV